MQPQILVGRILPGSNGAGKSSPSEAITQVSWVSRAASEDDVIHLS